METINSKIQLNAKELILKKINADTNWVDIYTSAFMLGEDLSDIGDFMISPEITELINKFTTNIFDKTDVGTKTMFIEQAIKDASSEHEKALYTELLERVNISEELRIFGKILKINQGMPTKTIDLYKYINSIESFIEGRLNVDLINRYKQALNDLQDTIGDNENPNWDDPKLKAALTIYKSAKKAMQISYIRFNFIDFLQNSDYQNQIVNQYEAVKVKFNILDTLVSSPHFSEMQKVLALNTTILNALSKRNDIESKVWRFAQHKNANGNPALLGSLNITERETLKKLTEQTLIHEWISVGLNGMYVEYVNQRFDFNSGFDSNKFKNFVESIIIPLLKYNMLKTPNGETIPTRDNEFVKKLTFGKHNGVSIYKLPFNMTEIDSDESTRLEYEKILNAFGDLRNITLHGSLNITDVFYLYNLIVHKDHFGRNSLTRLFEDLISSKDGEKLLVFKFNEWLETVNEQEIVDKVLSNWGAVHSNDNIGNSNAPSSSLVITPKFAVDKTATIKARISNKFIGFGPEEGSTHYYAQQAGSSANTGDYTAKDVIFVSVPGKRGDAQIRKQYQDQTIREAIKALKAGATLITDSAEYLATSDYNEGERRLAQNLQHLGYQYETIIVDGYQIGKWTNPKNIETTPKSKSKTVKYTPKGQTEQTYIIIGTKIFNKEGNEVYSDENSGHRKLIFVELALQEKRAVKVEYRNVTYVVNDRNQIFSTSSNKIVYRNENDGNRRIILERAKEEFAKLSNQSYPRVEIYQGYWTREEVESQTDKVFLFGDNTDDRVNTHYIPSRTQAVIRGLDNAIGIDTKKNRGTSESSYFTDADFDIFKAQVDEAIQRAINSGKTIVIPADGIGTGKAELEKRAPKLFAYLQQRLDELKNLSSTSPVQFDDSNDISEESVAEEAVTIGFDNTDERVDNDPNEIIDNIEEIEKEQEIVLNTEQQTAVDGIVAHINSGNLEPVLLNGKAGTGKTTIIAEILKQVDPNHKVWVGAVTHKASAVLFNKLQGLPQFITKKTVASMTDKKFDLSTGEFSEKSSWAQDPTAIPSIIFVDEASMVTKDDFVKITEFAKNNGVILIFIGDDGQLPPVEKSGEKSKIFALPKRYNLVERVRQGEESPILPYADGYWNYSHNKGAYPSTNPKDVITRQGAIVFSPGSILRSDNTLALFKKAVQLNKLNSVKVITWTNEVRQNVNHFIHSSLFGKEKWYKGEFIIFNDTLRKGKEIIAENSSEWVIESIGDAQEYTGAFDDYSVTCKIRFATITDGDRTVMVKLFATDLDKASWTEYWNNKLVEVRKIYSQNPKKYNRVLAKIYANLQEMANVDYAYAITCHKSQGSTYDSVFVTSEIHSNQDNELKAQWLYTAITRARNVVTMIHGDGKFTGDVGSLNDDIENNRVRTTDTGAIPAADYAESSPNQLSLFSDDSFHIDTEYIAEREKILRNAPRNSEGQLLAPNGKVSKLTEEQWVTVRTKAFKEWFGDWTKITQNEDGTWNIPDDVSKVIDAETGEPKIMYHGTPWGEFHVFKHFQPNTGDRTPSGQLYFSTNKFWAESYTRGEYNKGNNIPKVYEVFLNIRNPYSQNETINSMTQLIEILHSFYDAINNDDIYSKISDEVIKEYNWNINATYPTPYLTSYIYNIISNYYKDNLSEIEFNKFTERLIKNKGKDGMIYLTGPELKGKPLTITDARRQVWVINSNQIKSATGAHEFTSSPNIYDADPTPVYQTTPSKQSKLIEVVRQANESGIKGLHIVSNSDLINEPIEVRSALGFVRNGEIYINVDKAKDDTVIHEFGHLYLADAKVNNRDAYYALLDKVRNTELWRKMKTWRAYANKIGSDFDEEVLATMIGDYYKHINSTFGQDYEYETLVKEALSLVNQSFMDLINSEILPDLGDTFITNYALQQKIATIKGRLVSDNILKENCQ